MVFFEHVILQSIRVCLNRMRARVFWNAAASVVLSIRAAQAHGG
ncbi:hypothetical protein CFter6_4196 [Collimonas fungivorans]|uniref:Uncharacterized protein n=1 Tax=Collimonas fungivorans TaxID=158899 RepID=A0A127PG85_9BURK|nr:hypothetical protein CFter6_4196 [Collimonas fungivorans]